MSDSGQHPIWQEADEDQWDEFVAFAAATLVALRSALAVAWDNIPDIVVELERATGSSGLPEDLMMFSPSRTQRVRERLDEIIDKLGSMRMSNDLFAADEFLTDEFGLFLWRLNQN